jgi:very-short-patch-repair endonuclease
MAKKKVKKVKDFTAKIKFLEDLGVKYSAELKKNKTKWEQILINHLKELKYKFIFQHPVVVNKIKKPQLFILDFLLTDYLIVIEADSIKHHSSKADIRADNIRTKLLKQEGYTILRLFNKQIDTLHKDVIHQIIQSRIVNKS